MLTTNNKIKAKSDEKITLNSIFRLSEMDNTTYANERVIGIVAQSNQPDATLTQNSSAEATVTQENGSEKTFATMTVGKSTYFLREVTFSVEGLSTDLYSLTSSFFYIETDKADATITVLDYSDTIQPYYQVVLKRDDENNLIPSDLTFNMSGKLKVYSMNGGAITSNSANPTGLTEVVESGATPYASINGNVITVSETTLQTYKDANPMVNYMTLYFTESLTDITFRVDFQLPNATEKSA